MKESIKLGGMLLLGLALAGCATQTGAKAQDAEALNSRIASLEAQVTGLNQRVDEMSQSQSGASSIPSGQRKAARKLSVRQVQQALASAGYYKGSVDGKEGPQTRKAIKDFQQAQGLKADGVVGSATTEALSKYLDNV